MRLTILVIVLALLPASWALAITTSTVSFQNGINGYSGTFDRYINDGTSSAASPVIAQTDGSAVQSYTLNGFLSGSTPDSQGLIRFDNIFGNAAGQVPSGAFILDAQMQLTTEGGSTANGFTGQSNAATPTDISGSVGPFGVSGLLQPFSSATDYYTNFPNPGDPFGGRGPYYTANSGAYATRPIGSFGTAAVGQTVSAPVTSLVQKWSSGTLANNGVAIQAGFDGVSDDWQIHTTGYNTPEGRPKLTVTYTTDPVTVNTFQPGVGSYAEASVTMARVVGGASPATTDGATITTTGPLDGLDATTAEQLALVKFNNVFGSGAGQADPTKPVAKAWLVFTTATGANSRTNDPYDIDVMRNPWTTSTLYNQFGANPGLQFSDGDTTPSLSRVVGSANGSEAWYDVTSYLEAIRGGATDNGLAVRARGTDGWTILFNGATDPSLRPRLVVASQTTVGGSLQGDFNNDSVVDAKDYVAWRKGVVPSTPANYALWRANYGNTGSSTPPAAPTTLMNYDLIGLPSASPPTTWDPNSVQTAAGLVLPNSSKSAAGMTGLALSRGPGVVASGLGNGFASNNWTNVTADGGTIDKARAITNGDFLQFGATVDASHKASLSTLDFALRRSAVAAPMNYEVQVSLDGFATAGIAVSDFQYIGRVSGNAPDPDPTLTNPYRYMTLDTGGRPDTTVTPGDQVTTIDLSALAFLQNLTNKTITFRLYAWGDGATGAANSNTVAFGRENGPRITGFIVNFPGAGASLAAVPEPSTAVLMTVFGIVFGAFGCRRR